MNKHSDATDRNPNCDLCGQPIASGEPAGWSVGAQEWCHLACVAPDLFTAFPPENAKPPA